MLVTQGRICLRVGAARPRSRGDRPHLRSGSPFTRDFQHIVTIMPSLPSRPRKRAAQTTADRTATRDDDRDEGFDDWGLLGLLGLAGLLGRKRPDTDRVETRRV